MAKKTIKNHAYDTNVSPSDLNKNLMSLYGTACKKKKISNFLDVMIPEVLTEMPNLLSKPLFI